MTRTEATPQSLRDRRFAEINEELASLGLAGIEKINDWTKGDIEVVGINNVDNTKSDWYYMITFDVIMPDGTENTIANRFLAHSATHKGVVVVLFLNGTQVGMVRQSRLNGQRFIETPRGFGRPSTPEVEAAVEGMDPADVPAMRILMRELSPAVRSQIKNYKVWHLGDMVHDSGFNADATSYYLVNINIDLKQVGIRSDNVVYTSEEGLRLIYMTWAKARSHAREGHSGIALHDFAKQIRTIMAGEGHDIGPDEADASTDAVIVAMNGKYLGWHFVDPNKSTSLAEELFDDLNEGEAPLLTAAITGLPEDVLADTGDYGLWELGSMKCAGAQISTEIRFHLVALTCNPELTEGLDLAFWGRTRLTLDDVQIVAALYRYRELIQDRLHILEED